LSLDMSVNRSDCFALTGSLVVGAVLVAVASGSLFCGTTFDLS